MGLLLVIYIATLYKARVWNGFLLQKNCRRLTDSLVNEKVPERNMGRITIPSNEIRVPVNPEVTREYDGYVVAQQGRPIWTTIDIDVDNSYEQITLTAEFNYKREAKNPLEQRQDSKSGFGSQLKTKSTKEPLVITRKITNCLVKKIHLPNFRNGRLEERQPLKL